MEPLHFYLLKAVLHMRILLKHACLIHVVLALGLVLMISSCSDDRDRTVVDFSKTVPVARPGERASPTPPLRVAVAAMISPKETFDLYRQLLAYLGSKLGTGPGIRAA